MRLEDERDAFDGGGVGAFAALGETLFDEMFGVSEQRDALASFALAAEIVFQALAIGGFCEHSRERVFAEAAWTAEEHGVRNTFTAESAAQGGDDSFIAEEFGEAHVSPAYLFDGLGKNLQDSGENFRGDVLLRAHRAAGFVEAGNGRPVGAARKLIVHGGGILEMAEAGFLQILLHLCVTASGFARDEFLGLAGRDTEIEHHRFSRQIVDVVFQMLDPGDESRPIRSRCTGGLMGEIRTDVAVGQHDFAHFQSCFQAEFGFEAIARIEQCAEVRVNRFQRAKVAVQELADHFAEPGIVLRETGGKNGMAGRDQGFFEQIDLRAFAAAVDALNGDEFSWGSHVRKPV
jgi:hypothetical protein